MAGIPTYPKELSAAALAALTGGGITDLHSHAGEAESLYVAGAALTEGYVVGFKNVAGTPQAFYANATAASDPIEAVGIVVGGAAGAGSSFTFETSGLSPVIPTAAWIVEPVVADVGKPVHLSKTAGKLTMDVSTYVNPDRLQQIGKVAKGGVGVSLITIEIGKSEVV